MTSLAIPNSTSSANAASVAASTTASHGSKNSSSSSASTAANLTQTDFMQLLTAQLQYQSPLNPADPTAMASEFAQISTVDGINSLNTKVADLQAGGGAAQLGQAAGLIGKQVAIIGDTVTPNSSGDATGAFVLGAPAQNVTVSIIDPNGTVAGTLKLGAMSAGQQTFQWNGGTAGTTYTYQLSATDSSGAPVPSLQYGVYTVDGVNPSPTGSAPTLSVEGSSLSLNVSSVQSVLGAS
jgi:flagellar basal-body rod modification protein FlgD